MVNQILMFSTVDNDCVTHGKKAVNGVTKRRSVFSLGICIELIKWA